MCEDEVDQLLRDGVFVDLYAVVRSAIRVSQRSYSIKKLEPLYMEARAAAVTNAADSIVVYHQFMAARDAERHDEAARLLAEIADYNQRRLRLDVDAARLAARAGRGIRRVGSPAGPAAGVEAAAAQTPSEQRLAQMRARDPPARPARRCQAARALGRAAGRGARRVLGALPRPRGQAGVAGALRAAAAPGR